MRLNFLAGVPLSVKAQNNYVRRDDLSCIKGFAILKITFKMVSVQWRMRKLRAVSYLPTNSRSKTSANNYWQKVDIPQLETVQTPIDLITQLLAIRLGPGAAVLQPEITKIHMDFAYDIHDGHYGPRLHPSFASKSST